MGQQNDESGADGEKKLRSILYLTCGTFFLSLILLLLKLLQDHFVWVVRRWSGYEEKQAGHLLSSSVSTIDDRDDWTKVDQILKCNQLCSQGTACRGTATGKEKTYYSGVAIVTRFHPLASLMICFVLFSAPSTLRTSTVISHPHFLYCINYWSLCRFECPCR